MANCILVGTVFWLPSETYIGDFVSVDYCFHKLQNSPLSVTLSSLQVSHLRMTMTFPIRCLLSQVKPRSWQGVSSWQGSVTILPS